MKKILAITVLSALALPAFAQYTSPRIEQRQANQERRIQEGIANGSLTPHEAARLERGQARIRQMERQARANGVVTRFEMIEIDRELDRQSSRIARATHDRDYSYNGYRY